jgi:SAM-dependent methyltransferase
LKEKEVTGIQWHQGDATDMTPFLEDKVFDAAIDKGCLDALFCSDVPKRNVHKYLQEVERVLKEEGVYIVFSYGRPEDDRLAFLDNDDPDEVGFLAWTVDVHGENAARAARACARSKRTGSACAASLTSGARRRRSARRAAIPKPQRDPYKVVDKLEDGDVYYVRLGCLSRPKSASCSAHLHGVAFLGSGVRLQEEREARQREGLEEEARRAGQKGQENQEERPKTMRAART